MSENLHNIDDLFKKAIDEHEDIPSSNVWDAIDKHLDKSKVVYILKKYNKLKWVAAALLIFSFGMAMYTWHTSIKNKELVKKNNTIKRSLNNKPAESLEKKAITSGAPDTLSENKTTNTQNLNNSAKINVPDSQNISYYKQEKNNKIISEKENKTSVKDEDIKAEQSIHVKRDDNKSPIQSENNTRKNNPIASVNNDIGNNNKQQKIPQEKINLSAQIFSATIPLNTYNNSQLFITNKLSWHPMDLFSNNLIRNNVVTTNDDLQENKKNTSPKKIKTKQAKQSLFSVTAFYSPEIITANVKDDHPRFREDDKDKIKNNEQTRSAYSFGVSVGINLGKNWMLQSGINIFTRVTDINPQTLYARPDDHGNINYHLSCSAGSAYISLKQGSNQPSPPAQGDSAQSLSAKNTLQYISIPLAVKYTIGKKKLTLQPAAGIAFNILSKGKIETAIATQAGQENIGTNDIEGLKSSYLNSVFSMGAAYELNKTFSINFIPSARIALSSINKDAAVKTSFNSIGFAGGLTIKF